MHDVPEGVGCTQQWTRTVILPRPDTRLYYRESDFQFWSHNCEKFPVHRLKTSLSDDVWVCEEFPAISPASVLTLSCGPSLGGSTFPPIFVRISGSVRSCLGAQRPGS